MNLSQLLPVPMILGDFVKIVLCWSINQTISRTIYSETLSP